MSCEGIFSDPAPVMFSPVAAVGELIEQVSGLEDDSTCESEPPCSDSKNKPFSFLLWNVDGLKSKLSNRDFLSFLHEFDFVCLVDTFMEECKAELFAGFKTFCSPAVKLTKQGRRSGGIVCLIKNELSSFVELLDVKIPNICAFVIGKDLFGIDKDVLYICSYVPPEGSPFYTHFDFDNGICLIEDFLIDILMYREMYVILNGDLNSRTSNLSQNIAESVFDLNERSQCPTVNRCSEDTHVNNFGKLLLNLCTTLGLCILNGVCKGDQQGHCTYICDSGSSVIDYFLFSNNLFSLFYDSCELHVLERIESKHLPVMTRILCPGANPHKLNEEVDDYVIDRYVWNEEKRHMYYDNLYVAGIQAKLNIALNMIDSDINDALNMFNDCIKESAVCMKKRVTSRKRNFADWFDFECVTSRRNVRRLLRIYRRSSNPDIRQQFVISRREYKKLLQRKKSQFNKSLLDRLVTSIQNQKEFWDTVRRSSFKRKHCNNTVPMEKWFQHFQALLQIEVDQTQDD